MTDESIRKRLWKEMGVEPWYLRPEKLSEAERIEESSELPVVLVSDEQSPENLSEIEEGKDLASPPTSDPFRFQYLNSDTAIWVFAENLSVENRRILEDMDLAFGLLRHNKTTKKARKLGTFEWPLVDSSGDPRKALAAFFDKYQSIGKAMFICRKTQEKVDLLLGKGYSYRVVPNLTDLMGDGAAKKSLWEILKSIRD